MMETLKKFNLIWPCLLALVAFGGKLYSDVEVLKVEKNKLENNMIYVNTEMAKLNEKVVELLVKQDARITILEGRMKWEKPIINNNNNIGKN